MTYPEAWDYLRSIGFSLYVEDSVIKIETHWGTIERGEDELIHYAEGIRKARENVAER
jgi:hypothetical protein